MIFIAATMFILNLAMVWPGAPADTSAKDPAFTRQIVDSTLAQVDKLARSLDTLEVFGKSTLEQSATVLDMGTDAAPVLILWLRNRRKDWKTRYWAADMLAYVGRPDSVPSLLKIVRSARETPQLKVRALESIVEIWKMHRANTRELQADLQRILSKTRNPQVREKIQNALSEIDI